jgi:hypothetical protein
VTAALGGSATAVAVDDEVGGVIDEIVGVCFEAALGLP